MLEKIENRYGESRKGNCHRVQSLNEANKSNYMKQLHKTAIHRKKNEQSEIEQTNVELLDYKTFVMLISAEHEICPANKFRITNNCNLCPSKHS